MGISLKTHKMLWGRSGGRCSIPDCRKILFVDETETDDPSIVGDEAHIVAREQDGPRGDSPLTTEDRDKYDNLILLCKIHHKVIDDQPKAFTVELLHKIKHDHIEWFKGSGNFDEAKQRDDEIYATYVEKWIQLSGLNEWNNWSSFVFGGGQPHIPKEIHTQLKELVHYLLSRLWPERYKELESALTNFRLVLNDFINVFNEHISKDDEEMLWTEKFYKIPHYDEELYHSLSRKFDYHVDLVEDLMLELTRAGNYVCDKVRKFVSPSFRLNEGVLLVTSGPHMDLKYHTSRVEYREEERTEYPYPGLKEFMTLRASRDRHYGEGYSADYFIQTGPEE